MPHEFGEHAYLWHAVNPGGTSSAVPDVAAAGSRRCPGGAGVAGCGSMRGCEPAGVTHALP